jgi:hypothetical protein
MTMPKLAINGGEKVRTAPWPGWPIIDDTDRQAVLEALEGGVWGIGGPQIAAMASEQAFAGLHIDARLAAGELANRAAKQVRLADEAGDEHVGRVFVDARLRRVDLILDAVRRRREVGHDDVGAAREAQLPPVLPIEGCEGGRAGDIGVRAGDPRQGDRLPHDSLALLRQRLSQIVAGYEDAHDADRLRHDPLLQIIAEQPLGEALGSQPTLSRWENAPSARDLAGPSDILVLAQG